MKFSIIIALAPWRDAEILQYIKKLDFPRKEFEVIVVKGLNVPDNRNRGVDRAKGEILIFLDDDAIIEPDFLRRVDNFFEKYKEVDILGGPQLTPKSDKFFAKINGYVLANQFACPGINKRYKKSRLNLNADSNYITGALMIIKKKIFEKLEFDRNIYPADDVYFINSAKKLGFKIATSPEIYIYHRRRPGIKSLVKQIYNYGKSRPRISPFKVLFSVPSLFLIYLILIWPLFLLSWMFIIPLLAYIALDIIFSSYESFKNKSFLSIFLLPIIFLIIHLSYGLGFIIGMLKRKK